VRISIDIDEKALEALLHATKQQEKTAAVNAAIAAYLDQYAYEALLEEARAGGLDYPLSNEELEANQCLDQSSVD